MTNRPVRAFYLGRVLVGIIREVDNEHVHEFYGLSGEGRVLTKVEFWARIKIVKASEHFVLTKGLTSKHGINGQNTKFTTTTEVL